MSHRDRDYTADGQMIRALRVRKMHWRQSELAEAAGVSLGQISRLEKGKHQPQLGTLSKIASALGVEIDDLVDWHVDL